MSGEEVDQEQQEHQQAQDEITLFTTSYLDHLSAINQYLLRIRNVAYDAQSNTTTVYGHTNFQELKVNNKTVALAEQIPDI